MRKKGFTLIELVLAIVLLSILMAMSTPFIITTFEAWFATNAERNLVFNARLALNRVAREIRQAKNITAVPNSTWFNFTDINNESINFYQSGNSLYRNSNELTNLLAGSGGLNLTYYNATGSITSNISEMRSVAIKLNFELENRTLSVSSLVKFRNIK